MAFSVPLSRSTLRVGGGSAFFVRPHSHHFMIMTPMLASGAGDFFVMIPLIVAIFVVMVFVFQLLWNTTMPQVFKLGEITFWQAFRLLLLASILFGGSWVRHN
jgi:hypothetical protein